jgi:nucleotide-binding universal stress UspA family protein
MYKKILVPMALDHGISESTLEIARSLTHGEGEITALHVYEAPQGSVSSFLDESAVKQAVARAEAALMEKTKGLQGVTPVMVKGHTYRSIIDYAREHEVDCIVIGSHRPGLSDYLLGSTAARVVRHAPCAVHVYRSS